MTFLVGSFLFSVAQLLFERFGGKSFYRIIYYIVAALLSFGYYLIILPANKFSDQMIIKTSVILFALFVAFVWIPSIKEKIDFNDSFMISFKAIFTSAFFSAVIWGGISLIIAAVDMLLIDVDGNSYIHTINIIWCLFAPMLFLSMIPFFSETENGNERFQKASSCPRFLEILISYVLIPLTEIYTVVLLIYMIKTIANSNWNDNLLEPLILSYCVAVILLYILSSKLKNIFVLLFRLVFIKLLIPISAFQIISSIIIVSTEGIVHTKYYIIMLGLYSIICGIFLTIVPLKKNGTIAALAIIFAIISITPPIDAFSISRQSQILLLTNTLKDNEMLKDDTIIPTKDISYEDKLIIINSIEYLEEIQEIDKVTFLTKSLYDYKGFVKTFGFEKYDQYDYHQTKRTYLSIQAKPFYEIDGFDYFANVNFDSPLPSKQINLFKITKDKKDYNVACLGTDEGGKLEIKDTNSNVIWSSSMKFIIHSIVDDYGYENYTLSPEEMTIDVENDAVKLRIIFQNINIYYNESGVEYNTSAYILISLK